MKKLIFILMFGSLFADEIIYNSTYMQNGQVVVSEYVIQGTFLGILNSNIYVKNSKGKIKKYDCENIIDILDIYRKPIQYDCSLNTLSDEDTEHLSTEHSSLYSRLLTDSSFTHQIGGGLIAAGGVLLYTNIDKDISDYDSIEDWSDSIKLTSKLGYVLIILGGLFVLGGE